MVELKAITATPTDENLKTKLSDVNGKVIELYLQPSCSLFGLSA